MKQISTARAIAAAAMFTSLLAGCSSSWETQDEAASGSMGGGMLGSTGSGGGESAECDQYRQMTSERTPSDQLALMEQNMERMTPAMHDRHMSRMRQVCGGMSQPGAAR